MKGPDWGATMSSHSYNRAVLEENHRTLTRRWKWVRTNAYSPRVPMDSDIAAVLANFTETEISLAADSSQTLCQLAVDEEALANLAKAPPADVSAHDDAVALLIQENEDILLARWAAAKQDDIQARMVYGLSMGTLNWLKSATLSDLRNVARSGHPCVRLVVKPAALWQSAKCQHLSQVQRTVLHLVSQKEVR